MDNPQEIKKALIQALIARGDYAGAARLQEEIEEKPQKPRVKIVSKGGTNTNVVKKMIDVALAGIGAGTSDHGALTGLADDDHTQYLNNARGDARYYTQSQINTSLSGKADTVHTHTKSQITDFSDADYAEAVHTHVISDTTGLQTALDGKADDAHTHIIADTTGLQTALDGKAATSHSHIIGDVTGLQTALDGKAATAHTHVIGDVGGLAAALGTKLETVTAADIDSGASTDGQVLTSDGAGNAAWETPATGVTDHGALTGLADDDHTQYHTDARGDARYSQLGHTHTAANITDFATAVAATAAVTANTAKVTNATHTGEVTGSGALTVDKTAITNKTLVTAAVGDHILIADASDTDNLKRVTVQTIVDLAGGGAVSDAAYDASWNGDTTTAPSKNAVYDKIETLSGGSGLTQAQVLTRLSFRF